MKKEYLNNDFTIMEDFKKEKISLKIYLRSFNGSFMFFINFMNFYWNKLIDRKLAQKLYIKLCLWLLLIPVSLFWISVLNIVILMVNKSAVNQVLDDFSLIIICLILPIFLILFNPLLIFLTKKSMINFYYKKYYKSDFKLLDKPIVNNYYITNLKDWKNTYLNISRKKETKIWTLASDDLIVKDKKFIRENYESTLEAQQELKHIKYANSNVNIIRFEGIFIKWISKFLFISNKIFFIQNVYQKYNAKISIWKPILINWIFFIFLFAIPLILLIFCSLNGNLLNNIGLSIGLYLLVILGYPLIISPIKYFLIKNIWKI